MLRNLMTDDAFVEVAGGARSGPYKTRFAGSELTFFDLAFPGVEGDTIIQQIPGGREQRFRILASQYRTGAASIPNHFAVNIQTSAESAPTPMSTTNYNINGTNVQVGNHNNQQVTSTLTSLISQIENGGGTPAEKQEIKSKLRELLESPVAVAVLGGAVQGVAALLGG